MVDVTAAVIKLIAGCVTQTGWRFSWAAGWAPLTAGGVLGSNA